MPAASSKITFNIKDKQGQPLPDIAIKLEDVKTGQVFTEKTGPEGVCTCTDLPAGTYECRVDDPAYGRCKARVTLEEQTQRELALALPIFEIEVTPSGTISEIGAVKLNAVPTDKTKPYACEWTVENDQGKLYKKYSIETIWDPDFDPGEFKREGEEKTVRVEATLSEVGGDQIAATRGADITFVGKTLDKERRKLVGVFRDLTLLLKDNFDKKLDALSGGVQSVAARLTPPTSVRLQPTEAAPSPEQQAFWEAIRNRTDAISFDRYYEFVNRVLCAASDRSGAPGIQQLMQVPYLVQQQPPLNIHGVYAYDLLRIATQIFLLMECGVAINPQRDPGTGVVGPSNTQVPNAQVRIGRPITFATIRQNLLNYLNLGGGRLPYLNDILNKEFPGQVEAPPYCFQILRTRATAPCLLELIWSYWHEEGMLVQSINAISRRFQNIRGPADRDPLAHLEINPLQPLNNLLWGYIQDEQHRLTVVRRNYEYDHHYGLRLLGKAVREMHPADSRSRFLEAFHNLLHICSIFFKEVDDMTVRADGFPVLNALREVHVLLAQGAHNQFGDLPWTARVEMLIQQYLLARPEMGAFLRGRVMVPYPEPWMDRVETMKTLQRWTDVSIREFRDLAVSGERILLSIRYDNWTNPLYDANVAANWANNFRQDIQRYTHAYHAVTTVNLTAEVEPPVDATLPAIHLRQRLATQKTSAK